MRYLLDTDICIKLMRKAPTVIAAITQVGEEACCISEVTLAELRYGAEFSHRTAFHHTEIDEFQLISHLVAFNDVIPLFAREKARLRRARVLIPDFDLLIGATALTFDLTLITNNRKHLSRIPGVRLENRFLNPPQQ